MKMKIIWMDGTEKTVEFDSIDREVPGLIVYQKELKNEGGFHYGYTSILEVPLHDVKFMEAVNE